MIDIDQSKNSPETSEKIDKKEVVSDSLIKRSLQAFREFLLVGEEQKLEKEHDIQKEKVLTSTVLASGLLKQSIQTKSYAAQDSFETKYPGQILAAEKLQEQLQDDNPVVDRVGKMAWWLLS